MKILYDGQIYSYRTMGGINRYFNNTIERLPLEFFPTITSTYCRDKTLFPSHPNLNIREFPDFRPYRIAHDLRGRYFRWLNAREEFDIEHPTYYFLLTRERFSDKNIPLVVTIHDMIHELFADTIDPSGCTIAAKKQAIDSADKLICVSESTKRDLLHFYPSVEEKIVVVYEASELNLSQTNGMETVPDRPYFIFVGGRTKQYKNFDTLLIAFSKVAATNPEACLCVVGTALNDAECQQIAELQITDKVKNYINIGDNYLAKLYANSIALVYPSLYEGFGIPPLEAMACGTAVVASNSSSIPEIVGDAGILFDPSAVEDLADILIDLLNSPIRRELLIERGFNRHQRFSWEKAVAETVEVYKSIL